MRDRGPRDFPGPFFVRELVLGTGRTDGQARAAVGTRTLFHRPFFERALALATALEGFGARGEGKSEECLGRAMASGLRGLLWQPLLGNLAEVMSGYCAGKDG